MILRDRSKKKKKSTTGIGASLTPGIKMRAKKAVTGLRRAGEDRKVELLIWANYLYKTNMWFIN